MKVAIVQMNSGDDVARNLDQAGKFLKEAKAGGAELAVLPENWALMSANESQKLHLAEVPGDGPLQRAVATLAQSLDMTIVGGTIPLHSPDGRMFSASLVFDADGQCRGRYDKIHLFDVELSKTEHYRESRSFAPGELKPVTVPTPLGLLGLSVCYDLRFPELYRALTALGASVLTVPSAFTQTTGAAHWHVLLRARAVENQCFVLAPNQCGTHPGQRQTFGHSLIIGPWGEVLAECRANTPGVAIAELDYDHLQDIRRRLPVLRHRRL